MTERPYNITMSSPRFFCPVPLAVGSSIELPENAARHANRVLRLVAGDDLVLFNGEGGEFAAQIVAVGKDRVAVEVNAHRSVEREAPVHLVLVQALQTGDKMDLTIQKAVELGASAIVPVVSRRSVMRLAGERAQRRVEHWRGVVTAACEQCGRNRLPKVMPISMLEQWLASPAMPSTRRLTLAPDAANTLRNLAPPAPGSRIELLIGAEGGLAPEEIALAEQAGFVGIRLGPRVLRTETAGLAALAAMQCLWGDFSEG